MRADAGGVDLFKKVLGHAQVDIAHALDGQAHAVLAGVKHAVLARAVILELEEVVAVLQCEYVLGLSGIYEIHLLVLSFMFFEVYFPDLLIERPNLFVRAQHGVPLPRPRLV